MIKFEHAAKDTSIIHQSASLFRLRAINIVYNAFIQPFYAHRALSKIT